MSRSPEVLCASVDAVTAELVRDLLASHDIPVGVVSRGFDGVTVGHTPRDHSVHVAAGRGARARALLVAAWGERAVERLDAGRRS